MLPGDRLVCAFVFPNPVQGQFTEWPLHVTVVPWFRLDMPSTELVKELGVQLRHCQSGTAVVSGEVNLGRKRKLVNLIQRPSPYEQTEQTVRHFLHQRHAWLVDETTKTHRPYLPHITVQAHARVREGDTVVCDALYIIEQRGGWKEVVGKITLNVL